MWFSILKKLKYTQKINLLCPLMPCILRETATLYYKNNTYKEKIFNSEKV